MQSDYPSVSGIHKLIMDRPTNLNECEQITVSSFDFLQNEVPVFFSDLTIL